MRRLRVLALALAAVLLLAGCQRVPAVVSPSQPAAAGSLPPATLATSEMALVTTQSRLDTDFGQEVWNALNRFAGEGGSTSALYKTEENNTEAALSTLELAVKGGARLLVTMGTVPSQAAADVQAQYPQVSFVMLDAPAGAQVEENSVVVNFSAAQAGWWAGYVAAAEAKGSRQLGVIRSARRRSQLYTLGFLMGAEAASADLNWPQAGLDVYLMATDGLPLREIQAEIAELYAAGADPVFMAGDEMQQTALGVTRSVGGRLIGVDLPMSRWDFAMASIAYSPQSLVQKLLDAYKNNRFPGGSEVVGSVADGDITLQVEPANLKEASDSYLGRAKASFDSGMLALQLDARLAPNAAGVLPAMDTLRLPHLNVRMLGDELDGDEDQSAAESATASEDAPAAAP
ncbi:MAG: BMP family ABC transporter substrate-binding protein [Oscillospiraceae bacterium]